VRILEIIKANPGITVSEITERCGLTYNGAYYHIEKMKKKGILTHKGGDKGGEWVVL
ncbi:MAG: winged helix-turn-helix domain-containing protein, partial [Bacteroidales bacterium]|nr:winged helix-turn-helix domain-containing protein [Bacteroidales bacterium]